MERKPAFIIIASAILLSAFTTYRFIDWKIAGGYSIKFSGGNNSGIFKDLSGSISFDESNIGGSKFDVVVDVASINTGNGIKNNHAKSEKWFDAAKFPSIKFSSNAVNRKGAGYEVTGILEMHGIQRQVVIPFTFSNNIFSGSFTVNRYEYNIGPGSGSVSTPDGDIKVEISVPVTRL